MSEPRKFWVMQGGLKVDGTMISMCSEILPGRVATGDRALSVIELSAYQALEEKLRVAMEALKNECNCSGEKCYTTGNDILCDACEALAEIGSRK